MRNLNLKGDCSVSFNPMGTADRLESYDMSLKKVTAEEYYQAGNALRDLRAYQYESITQIFLAGESGGLLDVGCGDGTFVDYVSEQLPSLKPVGIDPYTDKVQPNIIKQAFEDYRPDKSSVRTISMLDVLEHFESPEKIVEKVKELLPVGGKFLVKVPNKASLIYRIAKLLGSVAPSIVRGVFIRLYQTDFPPPHFYYYDFGSLNTLVSKQGFRAVKKCYVSELPLRFLWKRLWGVSLLKRLILFVPLLLSSLLSQGSCADGLVVQFERVE